MIIRAIGIFHKKGRKVAGGTVTGWLLVTAVAVSLIFVGSLVWIDNREAVVPDFNPATFVQLTLVDGHESDYCQFENMDEDGSSLKAQMLVCATATKTTTGNGLGLSSELNLDFADRRTVAAYWDYGHLRPCQSAMVALYYP